MGTLYMSSVVVWAVMILNHLLEVIREAYVVIDLKQLRLLTFVRSSISFSCDQYTSPPISKILKDSMSSWWRRYVSWPCPCLFLNSYMS